MNTEEIFSPAMMSLQKIRNKGRNSESTLRENRALILKLIKDNRLISRTEIAERTGLRHATVTLIMNEFLESGLIEKGGLIDGENGRRIMSFSIARNQFCCIAVRINVSYVAVALYDIHLDNLSVKKLFMDTFADLEHTFDVIAEEIRALAPLAEGMQVLGVGVGVEGDYLIRSGRYMLQEPGGGLKDVGKAIFHRVNYPVFVNRTTNFNVYQSWHKTMSHGLGTICTIVVSYTLECGVMINGEILNGEQGLSGRISALPVRTGEGRVVPLGEVAATGVLLDRVRQLLPEYPDSPLSGKAADLNVRDVIRAFNLSDPLALRVYEELAYYLGQAVAALVNLLNPSMVYLSDEIPQNARFKKLVYQQAAPYLHPAADLRLDTQMLERNTKFDPSLLGAARYVADISIELGKLPGMYASSAQWQKQRAARGEPPEL